jgi:uncharacterized protein YdbL (DUF1318 family)
MIRRTLLAAFAVATLAFAGAVHAQSAAKAAVDAAKAEGVVGEQADGFLGYVKPAEADAALKAAVSEINAGRAQLYREAAAKNNVTPEAAGSAAFNTVVKLKLKAGEFYKPAGGGWVKFSPQP